ncbi:hypothetical protein EXIGLDRAFT_47019 [Exidia glandulosa HHB12029]|uniref:Uncharacterized protein n=1 Tax=Exidia glandulosa HHB12029 TaxID=1314781 RepID=A0A165P596_EXIGL|nr:hypothetical protein EXIGLDRAFT_47019 [Exidia glandulosa HHB12029]
MRRQTRVVLLEPDDDHPSVNEVSATRDIRGISQVLVGRVRNRTCARVRRLTVLVAIDLVDYIFLRLLAALIADICGSLLSSGDEPRARIRAMADGSSCSAGRRQQTGTGSQ